MDNINILTNQSITTNLIWENLSVYIDRTRSYTALDKVSGYARSGHILAVIGPPRSGKTTLIRLLSGRTIHRPLVFHAKNGLIFLNQQRITDPQILIEHSACVDGIEDSSLFVSALTVHQHLLFQAKLRIKFKITDEERFSRIEYLIKRLELNDCENTLIEDLSNEQGRCLSIASCLLTDPSIVFFDDFDKNLDPSFIHWLLPYLRSLNKTIIIVVDQPTVRLLNYVDDLCLFASYGRCLYMGPSDQALSIFHIQCPIDVSPGDFYLEQANDARPTNPVVKSVHCQTILQQQLHIIRTSRNFSSKTPYTARKSPATNTLQQIFWLAWRSIKPRQLKHLSFLLLQSFSITVIYGLLDLGIDKKFFTQTAPQNIAGVLFRLLVMITRICSLVVLSKSSVDYRVLERESKEQKLYSITSYYLSKFLVDIPLFAIVVFSFTGILVLLTGFQHYLILCAIEMMATLCSAALASLLLALLDNKDHLFLVWMPLSQILMIFSGIFINTRSIPFLLRWIPYISFYYYSFSLMLLSQWNNVDYISCPMKFMNNTRSRCYANGNDVLDHFNVHTADQPLYWGILAVLTVVFHFLAYCILQIRLKR